MTHLETIVVLEVVWVAVVAMNRNITTVKDLVALESLFFLCNKEKQFLN